jgi:hypothetical protein
MIQVTFIIEDTTLNRQFMKFEELSDEQVEAAQFDIVSHTSHTVVNEVLQMRLDDK